MAGPPPALTDGEREEGSPRWCAQDCCKRRPFFGPPGGKPLFCAHHSKKSEGMVDVSSRRCEAVGCAKWPLYGNEGQKAKFCSVHKRPSMIDVRSRRCAAVDCKRQPSYGFEGSRASFCAAHKTDGMVDVVSRRCERPHCRRRPLYGYEGKKSQFCSAHKEEGQVDVCNRRCQEPGCSKRPCFGLPGQRPCFCGSHRTSAMVDVISHKCSYPGCSHPTGYEAKRVRSNFCDKHKSVGLAGASLLQLAGSADAATPSPTRETSPPRKVAQKAPPSPTEREKAPQNSTSATESAQPGRELAKPLVGNAEEKMRESTESDSAALVTRRASYAAPGSLPTASVDSAKEGTESVRQRRFSVPTPLPSLGSLLESVPQRGHLKRPREDSRPSYDTKMRVSPPPAPVSEKDSSAPSDMESNGIGGDGGFKGPEVVNGGGTRHRDGASEVGSVTGNGVSSVVEQSTSTKRLFPGAGPRKVSLLSDQNLGWRSRIGTGEVGYLTSSLGADRRSIGDGNIARAASFDEARMAAEKRGMDIEDDGKPRRASAFVNAASTLTPLVTEMGRRDSAVEARQMLRGPRVGHYSDLLSAKTPFRGLYAPPRHPTLGRPPNRDTEIEGKSEGNLSSRPRATGFGPGPAPYRWPFASGARPAERPPRGLNAAGSPTGKLFHVMPAHAAFTVGLPAEHDETSSMSSASSGFSWPASRRHGAGGQVSSAASMITSEGQTSELRGETHAGPDGNGYHSGARGQPSRGQERRWSVLESSPPSANEPAVLVPAWGAPMDEEANEKLPACEQTAMAVTTASGCVGRRESTYGAGDGGTGGEVHLRPPSRRDSTMGPPSDTVGHTGCASSSQRRRWSAMEAASGPPDTSSAASVYVSAWGATPEKATPADVPARGQTESRSREPRRGAVFSEVGDGSSGGGGAAADVSLSRSSPARRGSMAATQQAAVGPAASAMSQRHRWSLSERPTPSHQTDDSPSRIPAWGSMPEPKEDQGSICRETEVGKMISHSVGGGSEAAEETLSHSMPRRSAMTESLPKQYECGSAMASPRVNRGHAFGRQMPTVEEQNEQQRTVQKSTRSGLFSQVGARRPADSSMGPPSARRGGYFPGLAGSATETGEAGGSRLSSQQKTEIRRRGSMLEKNAAMAPRPSADQRRRGSVVGEAELSSEERTSMTVSPGLVKGPPRHEPAVHAEYAAAWGEIEGKMAEMKADRGQEAPAGRGTAESRETGAPVRLPWPTNDTELSSRWLSGRRHPPMSNDKGVREVEGGLYDRLSPIDVATSPRWLPPGRYPPVAADIGREERLHECHGGYVFTKR